MAVETKTPKRFYTAALARAERILLDEAMGVQGFDEEIALLRVRLRGAMAREREDWALIVKGMDVLRRLVVAKYRLSNEDESHLTAFAEETLRRVRARGEGSADA